MPGDTMKKFHEGTLHSGSKTGPIVKSEKQAKAIQINQARAEGADIPYPKRVKAKRRKR